MTRIPHWYKKGQLFARRFCPAHLGGVTIMFEHVVRYAADPVSVLFMEHTMRTTLKIEVEFDSRLDDSERRQVLLDLAMSNGEELYAQAAMLAETPPRVMVTTVDGDGKKVFPLFGNPGGNR